MQIRNVALVLVLALSPAVAWSIPAPVVPPSIPMAALGTNPGVQARNALTILKKLAMHALTNNPRVNGVMSSPPTVTPATLCNFTTNWNVGDEVEANGNFYKIVTAGTSTAAGCSSLTGTGTGYTFGGTAVVNFDFSFPTSPYSNAAPSGGNFYGWNSGTDPRRGVFGLYGGVPTTKSSGGNSYVYMLAATVAGTPAPFTQRVEFVADSTKFVIRRNDAGPAITVTGSISGTTLTVTAISGGSLSVGTTIVGPGIPAGTGIIALGTGTGSTGTYTLNQSMTVSSESMLAGAATYRLIVNGQYVSTTPVTPPHSGWGYLIVDFTSAGGRSARDVTLEMSGAASFGGVDVLSTETVSAPPPSLIKLAVSGDSQAACGDCLVAGNSYPQTMADYLGIKNIQNSAVGATGMLVSSTSGTAQSRLSDLTSFSPDIVLDENGGNDCAGGFTPAQIQTAKMTYLQAIRAALPNVPIFVDGIHPVRSALQGSTAIACENAISAAVTSLKDPMIFFTPDITDTNGPWFSGTGYVGNTKGDGNLDQYGAPSGDGHITEAGWQYLGMLRAYSIMRILTAY